MKNLVTLLLSVLLFTACAGNGTNVSRIQRSAIQGIWWSPEMFQSAAFQIGDSTIYYPDLFKEYGYDIVGDTLMVYQDDGFVLKSVILRVTADTLLLSTRGFRAVYTRSETPMP